MENTAPCPLVITQKYAPLRFVKSLKDFKTAYINVVECHYLYEGRTHEQDGNDLNDYTGPDRAIGMDSTRKIGILNDWDIVPFGEVKDLSGMNFNRGGMPLFMASSLLYDHRPSLHYYRHDLESFFYILIWAMVQYDLKGKHRQHPRTVLSHWQHSPSISRVWKLTLFNDHDEFEEVMEYVREPFKPLISDWASKLWEMFDSGIMAETRNSRSVLREKRKRINVRQDTGASVESTGSNVLEFDKATMGGHVTFKSFMQIIRRGPNGDVERVDR